MCEPDYIISHVITGAESLVLIDGKCHEGSNQAVVGESKDVKRRIDDQTIIDNCWVSKTKIGTLKASLAVFWDGRLKQWDEYK